jgi:hypothetical protein
MVYTSVYTMIYIQVYTLLYTMIYTNVYTMVYIMVYTTIVMIYDMVYTIFLLYIYHGIYHGIYHLHFCLPWYIPKVVYTTFGVVYTMRQPSRCRRVVIWASDARMFPYRTSPKYSSINHPRVCGVNDCTGEFEVLERFMKANIGCTVGALVETNVSLT